MVMKASFSLAKLLPSAESKLLTALITASFISGQQDW
jgi:hypothetical protein